MRIRAGWWRAAPHALAKTAISPHFFSFRKTPMAEANIANTANTANNDPVFQIQRVYLKDVSLEQPNSPAILLNQEQPGVDIQLGVDAAPVADGMFEVTVTATVHTKIADKTVFMVEAKQAGIFEIRNMQGDQLSAILGIACPQIVYPYLRSNVADVIQRGGFPPVHMAEINFQAMYEQQQVEAAAAAASSTPPQIIV